ncbi:SurA N-terminal domain-containing protein [Sphingomonas sp. RS2018]
MLRSSDPTRARRAGLLLAVAGGALLLAGCNSEPTGQVVAKVNGEEVTLTELNAVLSQANVPENADKKLLQRQALEQVVERKLLADVARKDGIDQTPDFIVRRDQLEDNLLVQMMSQKLARSMKTPAAADIAKFEASNPGMFAERAILTVDQIRFPTPKGDAYLKELGAAKTMTEVVAALDKLGVKYARGSTDIDTAQIPKPTLDQIRKVPAGEPFVIPLGNLVTVSLITGSKPAPFSGEQANQAAANATRNTMLGEQLQQRLKTARAEAKIEYQPGYAPPAAPKGAPAAK